MDIDNLRLKHFDFKDSSKIYWIVRRIGIGFYIFIIYMYAIVFAILWQTESFNISTDRQQVTYSKQVEPIAENKDEKATVSSNATEGSKTSDLKHFFPTTHITIMLLFGALGSVFMVTRTFVRTVDKIDLPVVWYLTRPFQGALMSLFIYLTFLAGQIVFYSGKGEAVNPNEINVYTISLLAIVAGMFTDHAYDRLRFIADRLFKKVKDYDKENETNELNKKPNL